MQQAQRVISPSNPKVTFIQLGSNTALSKNHAKSGLLASESHLKVKWLELNIWF